MQQHLELTYMLVKVVVNPYGFSNRLVGRPAAEPDPGYLSQRAIISILTRGIIAL